MVQTVDFFTPIVDDPFTFGQIAAANSLSDIYAMAATPATALNIVCFPEKKLAIDILRMILRGGIEKATEAGVPVIGGHTVEAPETKYGLAVTGLVHPDRIMTSKGAKPGDSLILTKALGTGIIATAIKGGLASDEAAAAATESMKALNRVAAEAMVEYPVHACTDISGFGLAGHACEMLEESRCGMAIDFSSVPILPGAVEACGMGLVPAGLYRNRDFRADAVEVRADVPEYGTDILFDPQTSGGLLIAVDGEAAPELLEALHAAGVGTAAVIGKVRSDPNCRITVD